MGHCRSLVGRLRGRSASRGHTDVTGVGRTDDQPTGRTPATVIGAAHAAANEPSLVREDGGGRGTTAVCGRLRGHAVDDGVRGHAHPRRADPLRRAAGGGARRGHDGRQRPRRPHQSASRHRRHVPRRPVRHAARRLQPVRANPHTVALGRRPAGRRPGPRVPATVSRRVQRDGRLAAHARRSTRVPQAPSAIPAQPIRRLSVPEHLRPVARSVSIYTSVNTKQVRKSLFVVIVTLVMIILNTVKWKVDDLR